MFQKFLLTENAKLNFLGSSLLNLYLEAENLLKIRNMENLKILFQKMSFRPHIKISLVNLFIIKFEEIIATL